MGSWKSATWGAYYRSYLQPPTVVFRLWRGEALSRSTLREAFQRHLLDLGRRPSAARRAGPLAAPATWSISMARRKAGSPQQYRLSC